MNVDRFVLAFAGAMVVASLVLSRLTSPYWLLLTAFVGVNMIQASFTGFCPLAIVLKRLGVTPGSAFPDGGVERGKRTMSEQIKMVEPAEALRWFKDGQATVVDVRESAEFAGGHIPGAVLVPLSSFDPARVPVQSGRKLLLHCQSGMRCGPASAKLVEAGYKGEINRLRGGFKAWVEAGGPVEKA